MRVAGWAQSAVLRDLSPCPGDLRGPSPRSLSPPQAKLRLVSEAQDPNVGTMTHGIQVIGEYFFEPRHDDANSPHLPSGSKREIDVSALYLLAGRMGKWSLLGMVGGRAVTPVDARDQLEVLVNPSLFHDVSEVLTLGLEGNVAVDLTGHGAAAVIPQLHWQVSKSLRVQLGAGFRVIRGDVDPLLATRIILE